MALFRGVKRHENSGMWAYVEWSDENKSHFVIMGGKEFETKEEAEDFSKGFSIDSYEHEEPREITEKKLSKYGNVKTLCQSVYNYEFEITEGFSGKIEDTLALMGLCKKIAEGYGIVKKCQTDKGLFHLILSKR